MVVLRETDPAQRLVSSMRSRNVHSELAVGLAGEKSGFFVFLASLAVRIVSWFGLRAGLAGGGDGAELLQQPEGVRLAPMLNDLAVDDTQDIDRRQCKRLAGRR